MHFEISDSPSSYGSRAGAVGVVPGTTLRGPQYQAVKFNSPPTARKGGPEGPRSASVQQRFLSA